MVPTAGFAARSRGRTAKKIDCSPTLGSPRTAGTAIRPQRNRGPAFRSHGLSTGESLAAALSPPAPLAAADPEAPRTNAPKIDANSTWHRSRGTNGA